MWEKVQISVKFHVLYLNDRCCIVLNDAKLCSQGIIISEGREEWSRNVNHWRKPSKNFSLSYSFYENYLNHLCRAKSFSHLKVTQCDSSFFFSLCLSISSNERYLWQQLLSTSWVRCYSEAWDPENNEQILTHSVLVNWKAKHMVTRIFSIGCIPLSMAGNSAWAIPLCGSTGSRESSVEGLSMKQLSKFRLVCCFIVSFFESHHSQAESQHIFFMVNCSLGFQVETRCVP